MAAIPLNIISRLVSRIISMQNRNPLSKSYGCFDRNFWHFKTIIDFPSATYQQVVLGLSRLYVSKTRNNPFHLDPTIRDSIKSGIRFWCKIQNPDGSQNEYYENDRSFCPTAFTTFAVAKAFLLSKEIFSSEEHGLIVEKLMKGADWLSRHSFPEVQNQMIASMNALFYVWEATGNTVIEEAFRKRRQDILSAQNEEGWFPEYGGADIGYCFKSLDLICTYLEDRDDEVMFSAASKLSRFVSAFIHPDGTAGGAYGSRCTEHVFPFGIAFLSDRKVPSAEHMYQWFVEHHADDTVINPNSVDDKYTLYFYFNSYVSAFLIGKERQHTPTAPQEKWPRVQRFNNCGLLRCESEGTILWLNWKKKGVSSLYHLGRLIFNDTGYLIRLSNGVLCATQTLDPYATMELVNGDNSLKISIEGRAGRFDDSMPLCKWIVPFKLVCKTLLRFDKISYWFNTALKRHKIMKQHPVPVRVIRKVNLSGDRVEYTDIMSIESPNFVFTHLEAVTNVTTVHSPSSRFFQFQYLAGNWRPRTLEHSGKKYICRYEFKTGG